MSGLIKAHFLQPISNNLHQNNSVLANYIDGFIYYFDRATATVVSIPRTIIEIMEIPSRGIILPLTQQQLQQSQQQLQQLQQQLQQSQQQLQQSQQQLQQSQQQLQQLQQEHRKSEAHKGGQSGEGEHKERKGRDEEQSSEDRRLQEEEGHGTGGTITVSNLRETWRRTERPDFIRPFQEFWQGQLDFNQMAEMYARMFRGELGRFVDEMDSRFVHQRQAWIAHQIHGLQDPLPSRTMVRRQLAQQWLPQGIGLLSLLERPPVLLAIELQPQPNAPQRSSYARILVIGIYNTIGVLAASSCITFAYFASPEDRPYFAAAALGFDGLVARDLYRGGMSSTKAVLASAAFVVSVAGIAL